MKKLASILLCLALVVIMTGCTAKEEPEVNVTVAPDSAAEGGSADDTTTSDASMPVISGEDAVVPSVDADDYSYSPFTLESSGFYMEVPSHWERQPASKSVCFVEPVNEGEVPGRIVVTSKRMETITENTRESQLKSFFVNILGDFDTYEWTDIFTDYDFMGDTDALWVEYGGTRDGLSYKGYVTICAKNSTIYVFHFRCDAADYESMKDVIYHVRDSITFN